MLKLKSQESKCEKKQQKTDSQCTLKSPHLNSKPHDTVFNYMNTQHFFSTGLLPQLL